MQTKPDKPTTVDIVVYPGFKAIEATGPISGSGQSRFSPHLPGARMSRPGIRAVAQWIHEHLHRKTLGMSPRLVGERFATTGAGLRPESAV
jgi:hypothetical protein